MEWSLARVSQFEEDTMDNNVSIAVACLFVAISMTYSALTGYFLYGAATILKSPDKGWGAKIFSTIIGVGGLGISIGILHLFNPERVDTPEAIFGFGAMASGMVVILVFFMAKEVVRIYRSRRQQVVITC